MAILCKNKKNILRMYSNFN